MDNRFLWLAAAADFAAVIVHGLFAHLAVVTPLRKHSFPTPGLGDEDMTWRAVAVGWHVVTATFGCSAVALVLLALGHLRAISLPLFISAMHGAFLLVGFGLMNRRLPVALRRPIPIAFSCCMSSACIFSWLGTRL